MLLPGLTLSKPVTLFNHSMTTHIGLSDGEIHLVKESHKPIVDMKRGESPNNSHSSSPDSLA